MKSNRHDRWRVSLRRSSDISAGGSDDAFSFDVKAQDGSRFNLAYFSTGINRFLVRQQGVQFGGIQRVWDDRFRFEFSANYDFRAHGSPPARWTSPMCSPAWPTC